MNEITKRSLDSRNQEIIKNHYLHTIYRNYDYVKQNFLEKVNFQLSKSIWNNIIRNQQDREDRFLAKLGIKASTSKEKMNKLNEWMQENELLKETIEFQNNFLNEVMEEAIRVGMNFSGNETINDEDVSNTIDQVVKILSQNKQKQMNQIIKKFNDDIGYSIENLEDNISKIIKNNLQNNNNNDFEQFKNSIINSKELKNLKESILKEGLQDALNEVIIATLNNPNVTSTEKVAARRLKQNYNKKVETNIDLTNRFLTFKRTNFSVPLRWRGKTDTIDGFIKAMSRFNRLQDNVEYYKGNRDSIIYTIVNNLLFTRYNLEKNNEIQAILKMVRQSILYMAIDQIDKETDSDFLFIENKIVPLSLIMERIRDYDSFKPILTVEDQSFKAYDKKILRQKQNSPAENGDYYTGSLNIGKTNGELIWKSIRLRNLNLQLELKI